MSTRRKVAGRIAWLMAVAVAVASVGVAARYYLKYKDYQSRYKVFKGRAAEVEGSYSALRDEFELLKQGSGRVEQTTLTLPFAAYARGYCPSTGVTLAGAKYDAKKRKLRLLFTGAENCSFRSDGRELTARNGWVALTLPLPDEPRLTKKRLDIVGKTGSSRVLVEYYSPRLYAKVGIAKPAAGVVVIVTDLSRHRQWSKAVSPATVNTRMLEQIGLGEDILKLKPRARAVRSLKRIMDIIGPVKTSTSRPARLTTANTGAAIMKSVLAGKAYTGCTADSIVGRDFLRAGGIQARCIALMSSMTTDAGGTSIQLSENHTTSEMLIDGKWLWFDLTLSCVYVRSKDSDQWLSLWDLLATLRDRTKRDQLLFEVYSPRTKKVTEVTLARSLVLQVAVERYLTSDKTLRVLK